MAKKDLFARLWGANQLIASRLLGKRQKKHQKGHIMANLQRLKLVVVSNQIKSDLRDNRDNFEKIHGIILPDNWPKFPEAFAEDNDANNGQEPFCGYLFIEAKTNRLIGNGGLIQGNKNDDMVEIGYEIAPAFQGHGFATEAAQAMIDIAFENGAKKVVAHTEAVANPSNSVLKKLGMKFTKELPDEELGKVWQWKLEPEFA